MSSTTAMTNVDTGVLHNSEWERRWEVGETGFHQGTHEPMYERGHTVGGVEIAEKAVKELFEENKIEYEVVEIDKVGKLYKSKDSRLQVYVADLFDMSADLCGQFDIIWDDKSIVAINVEDHVRYVDVMLSMMKKDGQYYVSTIEYDGSIFPGPPHSTPDKTIRELFVNRCDVEMVEETDATNKTPMTEEELAKLPKEPRAFMTSSYLYFRWYCMEFK